MISIDINFWIWFTGLMVWLIGALVLARLAIGSGARKIQQFREKKAREKDLVQNFLKQFEEKVLITRSNGKWGASILVINLGSTTYIGCRKGLHFLGGLIDTMEFVDHVKKGGSFGNVTPSTIRNIGKLLSELLTTDGVTEKQKFLNKDALITYVVIKRMDGALKALEENLPPRSQK